jgi:formylmethanofuran dehydrogenase subunit E
MRDTFKHSEWDGVFVAWDEKLTLEDFDEDWRRATQPSQLIETRFERGETTMVMTGDQRPAVTREEYEAARAVLDALPPGVYMKCAKCEHWKMGGDFHITNGRAVCEACNG